MSSRNVTCTMQIGLNHRIFISFVNSAVRCTLEKMLCVRLRFHSHKHPFVEDLLCSRWHVLCVGAS